MEDTMREIAETQTIVEKEEKQDDWKGKGSPEDYFKLISHEITAQDAAFQLINPGETFDKALAKAVIPNVDFLIRICQCKAKLDECGLGEDAPKQYRSGINLLTTILRGLAAVEGRSRADFMQGLARLFAPGYYELLKTGKMSMENKAQKQGGIFRKKEKKAAQEEDF